MSTIKVNAIQNTSGVEVYTAKAWVSFDGVGTVAINASGNVTSIQDNGVGDYTVNFTVATSDVNYSVAGSARRDTTQANNANVFSIMNVAGAVTVNSVRVRTSVLGSSPISQDSELVCVAVFR